MNPRLRVSKSEITQLTKQGMDGSDDEHRVLEGTSCLHEFIGLVEAGYK